MGGLSERIPAIQYRSQGAELESPAGPIPRRVSRGWGPFCPMAEGGVGRAPEASSQWEREWVSVGEAVTGVLLCSQVRRRPWLQLPSPGDSRSAASRAGRVRRHRLARRASPQTPSPSSRAWVAGRPAGGSRAAPSDRLAAAVWPHVAGLEGASSKPTSHGGLGTLLPRMAPLKNAPPPQLRGSLAVLPAP